MYTSIVFQHYEVSSVLFSHQHRFEVVEKFVQKLVVTSFRVFSFYTDKHVEATESQNSHL